MPAKMNNICALRMKLAELGRKITRANNAKTARLPTRIPEYTIGAASLRKPALASRVFRSVDSFSVFGIIGAERALAASTSDAYLSAFFDLACSSISDAVMGR